ncbi:unnamed protein product, partial [Amoebophrya sp. A120]
AFGYQYRPPGATFIKETAKEFGGDGKVAATIGGLATGGAKTLEWLADGTASGISGVGAAASSGVARLLPASEVGVAML